MLVTYSTDIILIDFITVIIWDEKYILWRISLCNFVTSNRLTSKFISALFSYTLWITTRDYASHNTE